MRRAQSSLSSVRFSRRCDTSSLRRPVVDSLGAVSGGASVSATWTTFVIAFFLLGALCRGAAHARTTQYRRALREKESGDYLTGASVSTPIRRSDERCV